MYCYSLHVFTCKSPNLGIELLLQQKNMDRRKTKSKLHSLQNPGNMICRRNIFSNNYDVLLLLISVKNKIGAALTRCGILSKSKTIVSEKWEVNSDVLLQPSVWPRCSPPHPTRSSPMAAPAPIHQNKTIPHSEWRNKHNKTIKFQLQIKQNSHKVYRTKKYNFS